MKPGISGAQSGQGATRRTFIKPLQAGVFCLAISASWVAPTGTALAQQIAINTVNIEGNARIGDSAILSRAGIVPGQSISAGELNAGLQRLVDSGLFESVDFEPRAMR